MNHPKSLLIQNARLHTPQGVWKPGWLLAKGKRIHALGAGQAPEFPSTTEVVDAGGRALLPGFIDLHVHGAMGQETMDASVEGLRQMAQFYARHGTTAFLATTWTATNEDILDVLQAARQVMEQGSGGARLLGVHLEGPYLNPERCGAQDVRLIRRAERQEALGWLDTGLVKLVALAPEFPENRWLIEECARRGVTVSAGHTAADYETMRQAAQLGVRQVTHCFNAMNPLGHRAPGAVGAALTLPEIQCELIADNIHVHPAVQKILIDVKTPGGVILITDALRGAGLPEGEYAIGDRTVTIRNREARLPDGTLAGSVLTMERALHNAMQASGLPLEEAWPMSSLNAARSIGVADRKGSLETGKDADLVILDSDFDVWMTVVEGEIVPRQS